jgi:DNA repair exonuclease SbcCD ATPase subunit
MLYLNKLSVQGLRSIRETQEIDIKGLKKSTRIAGINHDTGGESGAGKTTVVESLDYLFGVSKIPGTVLKNRGYKEAMNVAGFFKDEKDNDIVITRNSKNGPTICINGEKVEGSSSIVEEKIDELIEIPRDIFRQMYHKKQKERGFFLQLTPKKSYEFLTKACGLNPWQEKIETIDVRISKINKALESANYEIGLDEENLKEAIEQYKSLTKPEQPELLANPEDLIQEVKSLENNLEILIKEREEELSKHKPPQATDGVDIEVFAEIEHKIDQYNKQYQELVNENKKNLNVLAIGINQLKEELTDKKLAQTEYARLKQDMTKRVAELKMLAGDDCPTCNQPWTSPEKKQIIEEKKISLREDKIKLETLRVSSKGIEETQQKISELSVSYKELDKEVENPYKLDIEKLKAEYKKVQEKSSKAGEIYKKKYAEYSVVVDKIKNSYSEKANLLKEKIQANQNVLSKDKMLRDNYEQSIAKYETDKKLLKNKAHTRKERLDEKKKKIENETRELDVAYEAKRAIKNYCMKIFQETLDTIAYNASQTLNSIPNVQGATVRFESFKEQKNGKTKDEITAFLNFGPDENVDIKSFSGGEETAIELAIDLAVIDVLEDKFNKGINVFVMDEPFNGMDKISVQECLEMIKNADTNKKLILIDHSSEVKEMIPDTIMVEKQNYVTRIINE